MSEWEIDNDDSSNNTQSLNPSEWEIDNEEPKSPVAKESYFDSVKSAPGKIFGDVANGIVSGIHALPDYYNKAKSEIPGLPSTLINHPGHAALQGLAGLTELGHNVLNLPHDVLGYISNRLNLIPKSVTDSIPYQKDISNVINQGLGTPTYPGEALIRGTTRNLDSILGGAKLAEAIPHLTQKGASKALRKARSLADNRNIGTLNVNPALIEDTRQFLPNTEPQRNAINAAQSGDYNSLFNLQSDLGKNASDYAKSMFSAAERAHGRAGLETRNRLLDAIHENLQAQGHHDISDLLKKGQNDYRRYIAFKPYRNILAGALGAGLGSMLLPENAISNLLSSIVSQRIQQ